MSKEYVPYNKAETLPEKVAHNQNNIENHQDRITTLENEN